MLPSHETANWPRYRVSGTISGAWFATEPPDDFAEQLAAYFRDTPNVALITYSVDTDSCSALFASDLGEARALEVGRDLLDRASPGVFANLAGSIADFGTGFVAPTIADVAEATKETAKGLAIALPIAVALGIVVAVLIFKAEIKAAIGAR